MRLWSVYGPEALGMRMKPPSNWVSSCLRYGRASSGQAASQEQQMVHSEDLAPVLVDLMRGFDRLPTMVEVTSGRYIVG